MGWRGSSGGISTDSMTADSLIACSIATRDAVRVPFAPALCWPLWYASRDCSDMGGWIEYVGDGWCVRLEGAGDREPVNA